MKVQEKETEGPEFNPQEGHAFKQMGKLHTVFTATYVIVSLLIILGLAVIVGAQASKSSPQDMFADWGTITWNVSTINTSVSNVPGFFEGYSCIPVTVPNTSSGMITFVVDGITEANNNGTITGFGLANQYDTGVHYSFSTVTGFPYNYTSTDPTENGYIFQSLPLGFTTTTDLPLALLRYNANVSAASSNTYTFYFHEPVPSGNRLAFCSDDF